MWPFDFFALAGGIPAAVRGNATRARKVFFFSRPGQVRQSGDSIDARALKSCGCKDATLHQLVQGPALKVN